MKRFALGALLARLSRVTRERPNVRRAALVAAGLVLVAGAVSLSCGKGKSHDAVALASSSAASSSSSDPPAASLLLGREDASEAPDPRETALWAAATAKDADPEEWMRLVDQLGCERIHERAAEPELRATALQAMQFCPDFSELPFLAQVGTEGVDADARAALGSVAALAARSRRSVDPEDADELHSGCLTLLALARATDRPKERRVLAIRSLRMLAEYGCVKRADLPTDLDAR